MIVSLSEDKS